MEKTVLITGSSRGIGKETALLFSKNGYNVVINYLNSENSALKLKDCICSEGGNAIAVKANVSSFPQVCEMFEIANKTFGHIDVLVNNAGIAQQKMFTDITDNDWDNMININLKGVFNCCKAVLPSMINKKEGNIINISSMWGQVGASCEVHYSAAKAGVIGLTKALAKEVGPSGIRVNCVAPGMINTEMNNNIPPEIFEQIKSETPLEKIGTSFDVAQLIYFLSSDSAKFITGQIIHVNGGLII